MARTPVKSSDNGGCTLFKSKALAIQNKIVFNMKKGITNVLSLLFINFSNVSYFCSLRTTPDNI